MGLYDAETPAGRATASRDCRYYIEMRVQIHLVPTIAAGLDRLEQASRFERLHVVSRDAPETFGLMCSFPQHGHQLHRAGDECLTRYGGRRNDLLAGFLSHTALRVVEDNCQVAADWFHARS